MSTPEFLRHRLAGEQERFESVFDAVLESGLEHRPDPKSRCARELMEHIIGHQFDLAELAEDGVIHHRNQMPFASLADARAQLDASFAAALDKLDATDAGRWMEPAKFWVGDHLVMEAPRQELAWILFLDAIHHRGQLSTHLRAMGSKVPALYGPSADSPVAAH